MQRLFSCFYVLVCFLAEGYEAPWGKDASLATATLQEVPCSKPSTAAEIGVLLIRFHQEVISPADGPRSHYIPSSSQYTLEAMQAHGFFQGFLMGCDRLMRENEEPWVYRTTATPSRELMKWDPVPK
jgi:putative component of membrane protein insertase Oxa1/YidC/SpoIIIJ protein YidD